VVYFLDHPVHNELTECSKRDNGTDVFSPVKYSKFRGARLLALVHAQNILSMYSSLKLTPQQLHDQKLPHQ